MTIINYSKENMDSPNYEIYYKHNIPMVDHPLHYHDFLELYFHIEGDCDYIIDSRIYTLQKGDIIIINRQKLHRSAIKNFTKPYLRFVLWLDYNFADQLAGELVDFQKLIGSESDVEIIRLPKEQWERMEYILQNLYAESKTQDFVSGFLTKNNLQEIILLICRYSMKNYEIKETSIKNDVVIQAVMSYIDRHYREALTLDEIANHFYMNKYHLMRKFKKHTQMTIMDYCKKKRLMIARDYLMKGISIQNIYKKCGFDDYSNFFRAFRSVYKMSPREYKYYMQKNNNSTIRLETGLESTNKNH
ncbi:MAG: AraC family transcriptional regulator [Anaerocolumna sp.]